MIQEETDRERNLQIQPPWPENCGWGGPEHAEYGGIHFKRAIATSLRIVEQKAVQRDARLSLSEFWKLLDEDDQTEWRGGEPGRERILRERAGDTRAYMSILAKELAELPWGLCHQYAEFVERSYTDGSKFTEREYRTFVGVLLDLVRRMENG